jgi:hypothetical protein
MSWPVPGDLRFRGPQPPANVLGVQNATVQPDECFQGSGGRSSTSPFEDFHLASSLTKRTADVPSEDCLFVKLVLRSDHTRVPNHAYFPVSTFRRTATRIPIFPYMFGFTVEGEWTVFQALGPRAVASAHSLFTAT